MAKRTKVFSSSPEVNIQPRNEHQAEYLKSIRENLITFGIGPAGVGKSYISGLAAVEAYTSGRVAKIIITRPAVDAGEKLGFLPGTLEEKMMPYLTPIFDVFTEVWMPDTIELMLKRGEIEIAPIAFMRGRSFRNSFILVDEAQNLTQSQMKLVLTRFGEGCMMVVDGDPSQTDLPANKATGRVETGLDLIGKLKAAEIEGMGFVEFFEEDVERHTIVKHILRAI